MSIDPSTTKYLIRALISAEGIVEKPDVVGAIFGQTEGLLGDELDLRDLQKSGRLGRIEVEIDSKKGKSEGTVLIPSSLDQVETAILAASLMTIDRVGPCKSKFNVQKIEDVRMAKKKLIVEKAKSLLVNLLEQSKHEGLDITDEVRQSVQVQEIMSFGPDKLPAGPNVKDSDAIIVVEGRSDVLNLLKFGIKNAIAVEGTNIPRTIQEMSKEKVVTAFVDGDRGGELILKELFQVSEVDFISRAPRSKEVEELSQKQIVKALRNKIPADQYIEMYGINGFTKKDDKKEWSRDSKKSHSSSRSQSSKIDSRSKVESSAKGTSHGKNDPHDVKKKYKKILDSLSKSSKAKVMNDKDEIIKEVPVKDLRSSLQSKDLKKASVIIFNGIITQQLVDVASTMGIKMLVANQASLTTQPSNIEIWTKSDL